MNSWDGPPDGIVGYWKCQVPLDAEENQQKLDPDALFDYFMQLCESPNNAEQDYQYVLALLLLRKKRLILDGNIELDDQPAMRLIGSGGEGPFEILERDLTDDQVADFQRQMFGSSSEAAA